MKKLRLLTTALFVLALVACNEDSAPTKPSEDVNYTSNTNSIKKDTKDAVIDTSENISVDSAQQSTNEDSLLVVTEDKIEEKVEEKVEKKVEGKVVPKDTMTKEVVKKDTMPIIKKLDYKAYGVLLKRFVSADGVVDYTGLKAVQSKLQRVVDDMAAESLKTYSSQEKLAYYINAYNANTLLLIVQNFPLESITKLGKPWDKKFIKIEGKLVSLNQIENEIVRPTYNDARVHAAFNCAAVSCPKLFNQPFVANKLSKQLDKRTKLWVNNAQQNNLAGSTIQVSKIFEWYKADFQADGGVLKFVKKYSSTPLQGVESLTFLEYDWQLNGK